MQEVRGPPHVAGSVTVLLVLELEIAVLNVKDPLFSFGCSLR